MFCEQTISRSLFVFTGRLSSNFDEHVIQIRPGKVTSVGNDPRNLLGVADIVERIRIEQDHVSQLSFLYGAKFVFSTKELCRIQGGCLERL